MAGTPPIVQTERVENTTRVHICFTIPSRFVDYQLLLVGVPHPMVPIAAMGSASFIRLTRERTVMENVYSSFKMLGASC
jgi:hypothetical protein